MTLAILKGFVCYKPVSNFFKLHNLKHFTSSIITKILCFQKLEKTLRFKIRLTPIVSQSFIAMAFGKKD